MATSSLVIETFETADAGELQQFMIDRKYNKYVHELKE